VREPEEVLDRAQQREVVVGALFEVAALDKRESSSAPTWPPPGLPIALAGAGRLGKLGCPQQELESAYSPLEGASSTVITSRPPSLYAFEPVISGTTFCRNPSAACIPAGCPAAHGVALPSSQRPGTM